MSTTAEAFREIDNLAGEARRLLALGANDPTSRSAGSHMLGVQQLARNGLRESLANQPKLAAYDGLLGACVAAATYFDACGKAWAAGDGILVAEDGSVVTDAEGLSELCDTACGAVLIAIAKANEQTAPDAEAPRD